MASSSPVHTTLTLPNIVRNCTGALASPTTPRANVGLTEPRILEHVFEESSVKTPTRDSFGPTVGQRTQPHSSYTPSSEQNTIASASSLPSRENSHRSSHYSEGSQDVEMEGSDDVLGASDNESVTSDTNRPSKKKKGQRFFCTDFPPCQLSFTRSEHLARHIRKHTGERPFQCHCSRRFSRLDNLRQHAQTVHVNEEIPAESPAATGTRFQRQIRTDRVRPPANRARTSTIGSQGIHARTHSRTASNSSITSMMSNINPKDDNRRRPPPLALTNIDTFNPSNNLFAGYHNESPGGYSTPTSALFSPGTDSSRYPSELQSPMSSSSSSYPWGSSTPGRRLSVPAGGNPFQLPRGPNAYPAPYISPLASSAASTFSNSGSTFASPTSPIFSAEARQNSISVAEAEWRRRTWHPSTYTSVGSRPATSGLSYYQTPDAPRPALSSQPAARQAEHVTRLPGIESFDHAHSQPVAPARRAPSPMQIDEPSQGQVYPNASDQQRSDAQRRQIIGVQDLTLQQNLTRLDIANGAPGEGVEGRASITREPLRPHVTRPFTAPLTLFQTYHQPPVQLPVHAHAVEGPPRSIEQPVTPKKTKRHGWYGGPLPITQQSQPAHTRQRTSPEDSSGSDGVPTPSSSCIGEYYPAIAHSDDTVSHAPNVGAEEPPQIYTSERAQMAAFPPENYKASGAVIPAGAYVPTKGDDMTGLEALVAVATRKDQAPGQS